MRDTYGLSDVWGTFAAECEERDGLHFSGQDGVLVELIDPESAEPVAIEPGATGELVFTHLAREATPVLRFRSRDLAEILGVECPCGRTGFRFRVAGRSDDMFRVRGVNVFPSSLEGLLRERGLDRFAVVLDRFPGRAARGAARRGRRGQGGGAGGGGQGAPRLHVRRPGGHASALGGEVEAPLSALRGGGAAVTVDVRRDGAAVWIRWSRPERLNAWDGETLAALGGALAEAAGTDARAIVLRGEGGAFSSGDDLRETATLTPEEWAATLTGFNRLTREVVAAPQPVIAAIDGVCVGGACELDRGLRHPGGEPGLPLRLPRGGDRPLDLERLQRACAARGPAPRAHRRARRRGRSAQRLGLVDMVVEDVEAEARRLVERIAALAPLAVAGSKRLLDAAGREALERALDREAALCEQLFETADAREGLAAFLEKRDPRFRGS